MAADLVKHGADPERVKKAMAADGYTFAPDNRSKREVAFDDAFGPPRAADGYKIGWTGRLPADADPIAAQELDTAARTWLHAMQFPSEVGNSLAEMVFDAARANADRTPQQRQEWKAEQDSILLKFARGDAGAADEAREVANRVLEYAPAEITKAFREAGALDDAAVIVQLSLQGRRMAHRIGLRS
jgi:hypothetical protein